MPLSAIAYLDFGYPWWLSYGHLPILALTASMLLLGYVRKWSMWPILLLSAVALWAGSAFLVERFVIDVNGQPPLPTQSFLHSGAGRVLDIGAGTGRSSIMVLQARPQATLVALDLFGESFEQHFGRKERLLICAIYPSNPPPSMPSSVPMPWITSIARGAINRLPRPPV
jgi:SAM-dependent methyltransferase